MKNYVHRIVINKKYLTTKQLDILNKQPINMEKWDANF
ncbi:MAG: C1 family peptidase [Bacilli bacterium]